MLTHEKQTDAESIATPTRITPQELAQAITTVEAQKEAEAQKQAEAASLSDTIQHLGLEVTPQELFAAVQAQRKQLNLQQVQKKAVKDAAATTLISVCLFTS